MKEVVIPMRTALGILALATGLLVVGPIMAVCAWASTVWFMNLFGLAAIGAIGGVVTGLIAYILTIGLFIDWSASI